MTSSHQPRKPRSRLARALVLPSLLACSSGLFPFALTGAFALLAPAAFAQETAPAGEVSGRVQNATSGQYLNNARVRASTGQEVFTDEYGYYRLTGLPAGEQTLTIFYSGLQPREVKVEVIAGEAIIQPDIRLRSQAAAAPAAGEDEVMALDEFVVSSGRDTDTASIAINEQRFAPNIKTVIETGAFGDVAEGNVGEFLKYLPGVTVDYVAADVRTASVRGFGPAFTSVFVDGFRTASAASGNGIRAFEFEQVSINNAARIEVAKVPTPDTPADALGGSINMIGKNAFEREGAQFNYRAYFNFNSEEYDPSEKSGGPGKKATYKVLPGFDFDYTLPVSKNLGFVVTGLSSNQFNEQHRSQPLWNYAQAGATPTNPFLQQYQLQDGPKNTFRDSVSVKMDWRISPESVLWVAGQSNYYKSFFGNRNLNWDVGSVATPVTTAGTTPLTWGPDFTSGASGTPSLNTGANLRGSVRHGTSFRDKLGATNSLLAKYRFNGRLWEVDAGAGYSKSKTWYRDTGRDHFSEVRTTLQGVSRVTYSEITPLRPGVIRALGTNGAEIDSNNLANYRLNTVRSQPLDASDQFKSAHVNVKRDLDFRPFDVSIKAGAEIRIQDRDIRRTDRTWNFVGPDRTANTADDVVVPSATQTTLPSYADITYLEDAYFGFGRINWPSPYLLYDRFISTPGDFAQTADQIRNAERFRIQNSQVLQETVTSFYLQAEGRFFQNRLTTIAGARFEKTEDEGDGPLAPTAGATLADVQTNWRERGLHVDQSYDGVYPSVHLTFNITDDLLLRAAYAWTIGRPDFGNILPLARVNDSTTLFNDGIGDIPPNTAIINNPTLEPYEADNYDLALEYYLKSGGIISIGVFRKDIQGFFTQVTRFATAAELASFGLDPALAGGDGLQVRTQFNDSRDSKIEGIEMNFRQRLDFIPGIGRNLTVFANGTELNLSGTADSDFTGFIERSANAGIIFDRKPLVLRVNVNHRGRQLQAAQTGAQYGTTTGFREYYAPRTTLDLNAEWRFSRQITVFANGRNVTNVPQELERYNAASPEYSQLYRTEEFGIQLTLGVKGTF